MRIGTGGLWGGINLSTRSPIFLPSCCLHLHGGSHLRRTVQLLVVDVIVLIDMIALIVGFCSKGGGCEHSGVSS